MIKKCLFCGHEFQTIPHGETRKYCFECSPSYEKGNNSSRAITITNIRHAIKKQLVTYKGGKCQECRYNKCLGALQFHHRNRLEKDFSPSEKYNGGFVNMDIFYREADKCDLLCANCHAEKHYDF